MQDVATFTASCEKYVGTESGGMDQAISLMGEKGIAKLIEFNPVISIQSLPSRSYSILKAVILYNFLPCQILPKEAAVLYCHWHA